MPPTSSSRAADGAGIECSVSARELTRFALIDDQFASVSKISTGTPYNDFAVTNEPVRGDIYVSVPETYAARAISFFATTKKGFVYKVACRVEQIPATQVFITNPAIAKTTRRTGKAETPLETSAVRLIQAMANDRTVDGYEVRQATAMPARVGDLEVQLIADYRGAPHRQGHRISRTAAEAADACRSAISRPRDTLAVSIAEPTLKPGSQHHRLLSSAQTGRPAMTDAVNANGNPAPGRAGETVSELSASTRDRAPSEAAAGLAWERSRLLGGQLVHPRAVTTRREDRRSQCGADDRHGRPGQPRPVAARVRRDLWQPSRCGHARAEGAEGREPPARRKSKRSWRRSRPKTRPCALTDRPRSMRSLLRTPS
jgi:conjugal transfer pilus assembly protein TraK